MSQPVALFGLKVKPGDVHRMDVIRDFKLTNVSFAADALKGNARAVVRVHITPSPGHPITEEEQLADLGEDEEEDEDKVFEERSFVLCTLTPGKIEQASVDIAFSEEEEIGFSVSGDNEIDLLGNYIIPAGDFDDQPPYDSDEDSEIDSDEFDEDDDEYDSEEMAADGLEDILAEGDSDEDSDRFQELGDVPSVAAQEKKAAAAAGKKRKAVAEPEVEDADVSMASTTAPVTDAELAVVAAAEGLDVSKLTKAQRKRLNKKLRTASGEAADADASVVSAASEKPAAKAKEIVKATVVKDGKAKTAAKETTAKDGKQTSNKTKTASGLIIEVKKEGTGAVAKKGAKVGMRYIGKLTNGKVFDSNTKGKPFFFKLGRGEVIKGWDEGVAGMKVGEERRLTCPPQLAYGSRGAPPDIPKNATLVFDVRLEKA